MHDAFGGTDGEATAAAREPRWARSSTAATDPGRRRAVASSTTARRIGHGARQALLRKDISPTLRAALSAAAAG
jgi:hypothetical protein